MPRLEKCVILLMLLATAFSAHAQNAHEPGSMKANVMLCDSPEHAIAFTVAINGGATDDLAKDIVGKTAGAEVCDKFIGHASIEMQKTVWEKGLAYIVTAYNFKGVGEKKWSAIPKDQD